MDIPAEIERLAAEILRVAGAGGAAKNLRVMLRDYIEGGTNYTRYRKSAVREIERDIVGDLKKAGHTLRRVTVTVPDLKAAMDEAPIEVKVETTTSEMYDVMRTLQLGSLSGWDLDPVRGGRGTLYFSRSLTD